jgi:hypothetical protein
MRFARYVFTCAGIWGLVVLTPLYFSFDLVGRLYPPAVTHPDFFYGFIGVATAWQFAFLSIGRDPIRLQAMMIPAILEKFIYVATLAVLFVQGSLQVGQFSVAIPDLLLGVLFVASFAKVEAARQPPGAIEFSGALFD